MKLIQYLKHMNFKKPFFWDLSKPKPISYLLIPLTLPIVIRNFLFRFFKRKKQSMIKTICVGNIYLGGTGKTPLTIKLYEILSKLNHKVATVKKNYSSQKDEQLLLKKKNKSNHCKLKKNSNPRRFKTKLRFPYF